MKTLSLDGSRLTIEEVTSFASGPGRIRISPQSLKRMKASRDLVERWVRDGESVYGVTTGFGEFANVRIAQADLEKLQENLLLSHAAGAGPSLPPEVVRAMMILRVNALVKGYSGIRIRTVERVVDMFNRGWVPVIPSQGSVGASGDLVQLAHLVLPLLGRGLVSHRDAKGAWRIDRASDLLRKARLRPHTLDAKEGLALINGTQMMTAFAALAVHRARALAKAADVIAAISVEALRGSDTPFDERIHRLRPYRGQRNSARNMRVLMKDSALRESHRHGDARVQDAYSIRCIPQVHGASRDAIDFVFNQVSVEINSANDNPLIFAADETHLEGGNFHGQPMALATDFLAIALSELANISERRTERLVNGSLSGLPRFLTKAGGLNSGLMIAQYTAASLVSENKVLCHPASVDSIPTSANQEDHNSMGSIGAQKAWTVLRNAETVLAIELLCACQGLDFACTMRGSRMLRAGTGAETARTLVRRVIPPLEHDRILHRDIQSALGIVQSGDLVREVERACGTLA